MAVTGKVRADEIGGNPPVRQAGTPIAFRDSSKVVAQFHAKPLSWGGARNRADRVSEALTLQQARGIMAAAAFALQIGLPLNRHLTVHWARAGINDAGAAAATGAFLKRARQLFQKRAEPFAYIWVRENDGGDGSKGSHVHLLLHVPPSMARRFTRLQLRWLRQVTGQAYRTDALHTSRIGGKLNAAGSMPDKYRANLQNVVAYVLKGAEPVAAQVLGLTKIDAGGRVIGKRCGWSENIGAAARER